MNEVRYEVNVLHYKDSDKCCSFIVDHILDIDSTLKKKFGPDYEEDLEFCAFPIFKENKWVD